MSRPMPVPGTPPKVEYRGRARAVLTQIVRAACPPDADALGLTEYVVGYVQDALAYAPILFSRGLALGLVAVDAASVVDGGGTPLSRMSIDEARKYVEHSGDGGLNLPRTAVIPQVRLLALMGYFAHPSIRARIGYDPDAWIAHVKKERLERHANDL